ncbi:Uu.00g023220.m01.CDS01 [Anthostomella pinea]|uniref:Uu.00g023220.m01.CDS01 n=1 Tax=Anthostomella pinea TaxID=933095 RepID=A0AAI8W181_9PEZI|nr:Uu.00g023220.m01.CDS01 [Anthostomella pinea]
MPKRKVIELHPTGWENDPADELLKLGTLDYCVGQVYTNYALFFKLSDAEKPKVIPVLTRGLQVLLSQCRQLCGIIEEHPDGGLCFHKKRDSVVEFHVQWLDGPEGEGKYPTLDELEKRHFTTQSLGDLDTWCVAPMTYGERPAARPTSNPKVAAFKATFIRGGMVFMMHHHHYCNDIMGWAGEMHQLAENCAAVWRSPDSPSLPPWDPACLDYTRVRRPDPPEDQRVDGPPRPTKHPGHKTGQWLLLHLPKRKMAELKKMASPEDGSYWISSHDAYSAYLWRMLSKHRAKVFDQDLTQHLLWGEAVNMRTRFNGTPLPKRIQGNVVSVAMSATAGVPQLTAAEVISEAPLTKLAWFNRQLTNLSTEENLQTTLSAVAAVRNKTTLFLRMDSFPPLSNITTDWRDSAPFEADFGFGRPCALRHPFDTVTPGYIIIFPARANGGPAGEDEGFEFLVGFEKEAVDSLISDPEFNRYFEFRGIDAEEPTNDTGVMQVM